MPITREELHARAAALDLLQAARGAWHLCQSLLATREGPTDDLIGEVADALAAAIAKAEGYAATKGEPS